MYGYAVLNKVLSELSRLREDMVNAGAMDAQRFARVYVDAAAAQARTATTVLANDGSRVIDRVDPADPALVTELLRLHGPVQSTVRTATTDHTIAGTRIAAGDTVLVVVAAANRDPAVFDQPDQFRLDRHGSAPLSFGYGAHYCLGAAVAQLELLTAIPKIFDRQPVLAGSVHWRDAPAIRGPLSVPLIFSSTSGAFRKKG
jgi:cytochrome P450